MAVCVTRGKVFCVYCHYCCNNKGMSMKVEDEFTNYGFDNWKKACEKFSCHCQSDLHKDQVLHS